MALKVLITGGTGLLGRSLCTKLLQTGHDPIVVSRNAVAARGRLPSGVQLIQWQPGEERVPREALKGVEAVINLAGENIGAGRWTASKKQAIRQSRLSVTRELIESFQKPSQLPKVFISGSAIGYYGPHSDEELTEASPPGHDFLAEVCRAWELEANRAKELGIRVVILRTGMVLAREGGVLPRTVLPFRLFLGGSLGSGRQWVSWIHITDAVDIIQLVLERTTVDGPVNLTAPQPVRMEEFTSILGRVLKRPSSLRIPAWVLKMALGEMANLLLTGQRVLPARVLQEGYKFSYPELAGALEDLLLLSGSTTRRSVEKEIEELNPLSAPFIEKEKVIELLKYFTKEEADILKMRYGIDQPAMPIYKIAELKNMDITQTKLTLRNIERRLLNKLRRE